MADCGQPGRPMPAGIWLVVCGENSSHNIFVEFQTKGQIDLLGNAAGVHE
jgi:hypothetical protein